MPKPPEFKKVTGKRQVSDEKEVIFLKAGLALPDLGCWMGAFRSKYMII